MIDRDRSKRRPLITSPRSRTRLGYWQQLDLGRSSSSELHSTSSQSFDLRFCCFHLISTWQFCWAVPILARGSRFYAPRPLKLNLPNPSLSFTSAMDVTQMMEPCAATMEPMIYVKYIFEAHALCILRNIERNSFDWKSNSQNASSNKRLGMPGELDTNQIREWRSILTLIVFVLTSKRQPSHAITIRS